MKKKISESMLINDSMQELEKYYRLRRIARLLEQQTLEINDVIVGNCNEGFYIKVKEDIDRTISELRYWMEEYGEWK